MAAAIASAMPTLSQYDERLSIPVARKTANRLRDLARDRELSLNALVREAIRCLLDDEESELTSRTRKRKAP